MRLTAAWAVIRGAPLNSVNPSIFPYITFGPDRSNTLTRLASKLVTSTASVQAMDIVNVTGIVPAGNWVVLRTTDPGFPKTGTVLELAMDLTFVDTA
jgi:hypothetical protein